MPKEEPKYKPVTWSEDGSVMFLDGKAWATEYIEKRPQPPAVRAWATIPICLGDEDEVRAILSGGTIPDIMPSRQVTVLAEILERMDDDRDSGFGERGVERRGTTAIAQYKKEHAKLRKVGKRVAVRKGRSQ